MGGSTNKNILLLGAGYVAPPCLNYLLRRPENNVTIAARTLANAQRLASGKPNAKGISLDVTSDSSLEAAVAQHDLVISLIPYTQHARVIAAAIKHKKHVVTTSYISPAMQALDQSAKDAGITVFNEIGVDPGIDHLYAIKTIEEVHKEGGKILSFLSYCGGLPAPEASDNPFGYKFSWSARGTLLALRNNARYLENGKIVDVPGSELMSSAKPIFIYPAFAFEGYANRDSSFYNTRYNIPECQTVLRGTLRYQGWKELCKCLTAINMLTEDQHEWLQPSAQSMPWNKIMAKVLEIDSDKANDLIAAVESKAGLTGDVGKRVIKGLTWIGLFSDETAVCRGTTLDTLCGTLEMKMQYAPGERDMVMLQHKFEVELADGTQQTRTSTGLWFGEPNGVTAMAKTVGVPCAITAQMILDGKITQTGVLAPMTWELCEPLIEALAAENITMKEAIL